jgi:formate--tetrahydrofolate ligase
MTTDIEIAREAKLEPIGEIASKLEIPADALHPFGHHIAKLNYDYLAGLNNRKEGRLVLVTAISPTPAGEGKTTTTVGLGDGLRRLGYRAAVCLREPSLGPCLGMKGGAAGGGYAQIVPMEAINLHFTGDMHAIAAAHNLLSAMTDNHIHWGNELDLDLRRISWRRVLDLNDRALRQIVSSLGGVGNGFPRETGFDITVASEVMAAFCLADSLSDLQQRLGRMVIGETRGNKLVTAQEVKAEGAMTVLLKDALQPNLVQSLEGTPAFVHGGAFANIAHGCNSVLATRTALKTADIVVTEAGFGADLGAEKFMNIKCRQSGMSPEVIVIVATIRALKMHGGVKKDELQTENPSAVETGCANLGRHLDNLKKFGIPAVVAINHFSADTDSEISVVQDYCQSLGVPCVLARHWAEGGQGTEELARTVVEVADGKSSELKLLYDDQMSLFEKIKQISTEIYRAEEVTAVPAVHKQLQLWEKEGYGHLPICIAKTQYSFSTDPNQKGAPEGHSLNVREVFLSAGAGFIVAVCGDIMRMPGLPRVPAAEKIRLDEKGQIEGLF